MIKTFIYLIISAFIMAACTKNNIQVKKETWGCVNNQDVYLYTITNANNLVIKITNYGGIITSIITPNKHGEMADIVLGFDNLEQYLKPHPSFGAIIGRFANRIENATFDIDGSTFPLTQNLGNDMLHGNHEFESAVWHSKIINNQNGKGIQLQYLSKDGTNGFPGNVKACITYTLSNDNDLRITFEATTDKTTHLNLTQHSYFNLSGKNNPIYDHIVQIDADHFIAHNSRLKPTREIRSLKNTPLDLYNPTRLSTNIQNIAPNGYNHCYVLNKPIDTLSKVAKVLDPRSGRTLHVSTTQPGIIFYTANYLDGTLTGKNKEKYLQHSGLCLETQHYPDAPNIKSFPSTLLKPGERYREVAIYSFGTTID